MEARVIAFLALALAALWWGHAQWALHLVGVSRSAPDLIVGLGLSGGMGYALSRAGPQR